MKLQMCSQPLPSRKIKDVRGEVFGRLTVVGLSHISDNKGRNAYWNCVCTCGNQVNISSKALRCGSTKSCGCLAKELSKNRIKQIHNKGEHLYFIKVNNYIKVGRADNPIKRLGDIKSCCPYECELLLVLKNQGYREKYFHNKLKNYLHTGEWFNIDWKTLCDVTDIINANVKEKING